MTPLFKKLNLTDQNTILIVRAPAEFEAELTPLTGVSIVRAPEQVSRFRFAMIFTTTLQDVESAASEILPKAEGDAIVWFCYPKASSKKYRCEFNRDTGWASVGACGFEPVRMVAVDSDWSALRFRRVEYIKTLTRDPKMALSAEGKKRTSKKEKK